MKNAKIFYLFFILVTISACTKLLPLEIGESVSKLVVNSIILPDTNIVIYIGATQSISDTNILNIDAKLDLYENENYVSTLNFVTEGVYSTDYRPFVSKSYKIVVSESNYETCIATDTIPEKTLIDEATFYLPAGFDEYGTPFYEATINFKDKEDVANFYEIVIYSGTKNTPQNFITDFSTENIALINEGDAEYLPTSLFFSDEMFEGKEFEIKIKFTSGYQMSQQGNYEPDADYYILLRSISRSYYFYRKGWTRHAYNQTISDDVLGMLFKGEPIDAYTNITNGYGVFVAYNQDCKKLILSKK